MICKTKSKISYYGNTWGEPSAKLDVLSSLNERCDSLISKLIMIFEKRKVKGAMQNLIFEKKKS